MRFAALILLASLFVAVEPAAPLYGSAAWAQTNDNDYTPLNSRIRRDRQFPTEPRGVAPAEVSEVTRRRSLDMIDHFAKCIWDRSNEDGLDMLARTDFGFTSFAQIGLTNDDVIDRYPIRTCLSRVASRNNSGVQLRYSADGMRRWYIQAAYLEYYPDGATWVRPGYAVAPREYPLSANNGAVQSAMNLADCIVAGDPYGSDLYFRTQPSSPDQTAALRALVPAIGPCVPAGQDFELDPFAMRVWLGEGLWHASRNSRPASTEAGGGD
ncbi:MAG: hypothetical protein JY451_13500 [Erythrobacter sp.]|nr:MAG: hypothetical protein JY451_13500 [Erythrobacter sp.]